MGHTAEEALNARADTIVAADVYTSIGTILFQMNESEKALHYLQQAKVIHETVLPEDHPHRANAYMNLGTTLNGLKRFDESVNYHLRALEVRGKHPEMARAALALSYGNLGRTYLRMGDLEKASELLSQSIVLRKETMGERSWKTAE